MRKLYIPEFLVGFVAGAVVAMAVLVALAWKYGKKEGGEGE